MTSMTRKRTNEENGTMLQIDPRLTLPLSLETSSLATLLNSFQITRTSSSCHSRAMNNGQKTENNFRISTKLHLFPTSRPIVASFSRLLSNLVCSLRSSTKRL